MVLMNRYKINPEYIFDFGKHKGFDGVFVQKYYPKYFEWCLKNIEGFKEKAFIKIENLLCDTQDGFEYWEEHGFGGF